MSALYAWLDAVPASAYVVVLVALIVVPTVAREVAHMCRRRP